MDPLQILQTTLAGLMSGSQLNNTVAQNETASAAAETAAPLNLSTLLSFLLSFSALRDWLKLFIIGGAIETCRRTCISLWAWFMESFWITACLDERDMSYSKSVSFLLMYILLSLPCSLALVLAVQAAQVE